MILYHGSQVIVKKPEIKESRYTKDFSFGFYCTYMINQTQKWATRINGKGFVNVYDFTLNNQLKTKKFDTVNIEWL